MYSRLSSRKLDKYWLWSSVVFYSRILLLGMFWFQKPWYVRWLILVCQESWKTLLMKRRYLTVLFFDLSVSCLSIWMYVRHAVDILREQMQYGYRWTNHNVWSDSFGDPLLVVGRWSIIIESWSKSSGDATIDYAFFIIDCRGKIKNLVVRNKSIKINKNVR